MEHRKRDRYALDVPVKLSAIAENNADILDAHLVNISSGGVYLESQQRFPEGRQVNLELRLPVNRLLEMIGEQKKVLVRVNGRVVRSEESGMAIQFNKDYEITAIENDE